MCGEKQSLKHVYGIGSGKECRLIVQKFSEKNMEADLMTTHTVERILDGTIKIQEQSNENIKKEQPESCVNERSTLIPQTSLSAVQRNFYTRPENSTKYNPYTKSNGTSNLPKLVGYHNKEGSQSSKELPKPLSVKIQEESDDNIKREIKTEPDSCANERGSTWINLFKNFTEEEEILPKSSFIAVPSNFYTKPERKSSYSNHSTKLTGAGEESLSKELSTSLETLKKVELPEIQTNNDDYWGTDNLNDEELDEILKLDF